MIARCRRGLFSLLLLLMLLPQAQARADALPPTNMEFTITQSFGGDQLSFDGKLYGCNGPDDCQDATELPEQDLYCEARYMMCIAHIDASDLQQFYRLDLNSSDGKTRESNIFQSRGGMDSRYNVTIRPNDLLVQPDTGSNSSPGSLPTTVYAGVALGGACLLFMGMLVGFALVFAIRRKKSGSQPSSNPAR